MRLVILVAAERKYKKFFVYFCRVKDNCTMKHIAIFPVLAAAVLALASCGPLSKVSSASGTPSESQESLATRASYTFPTLNQDGRIAIVAHRGYWKCEAGGMSENSIASLKAAQDNGFWGSECDLHVTADGVVIVNHDDAINGKKIATHKYSDFAADLLPNGEKRPTLEEYLAQAVKSEVTKLVIEFKPQNTEEREDMLVDKTIAALQSCGLYKPERVLFISFSHHICEKVANEHPAFVNQYLSSNFTRDENPSRYAQKGINGIDYFHPMFTLKPAYVKTAHELGMSVNAWTVDVEKDIKVLIDLGVDAITTNEPLLVRRLLGDKEFKK